MKNYNSLKKSELIEELKKVRTGCDNLSEQLKERDKKLDDALMENYELSNDLEHSSLANENIRSRELLEYRNIRVLKLTVSVETIIILILIMMLLP